jgi:uncharacterized protein (TIGR02996 family)
MLDRDALLAAITANPDEDTPRLVYADWLQENGEEARAEFIRLQCRIEHTRHGAPGWDRLLKREKELRVQLFAHLATAGFADLTFRRGFVGTVTSGLMPLLESVGELPPEDAPAFELVLRDDEADSYYDDADVEELADRTELCRCVSLDLPCLGLAQGETILRSPHLTALRRLNFPDNETGPGIEFVAAPTFANLRWANFYNSDSAADCPSIVPLAECPHLANLEYLDFGACEQGDEGARAVAAAEQWSHLRYLNVSCSSFTVDAVAELLATPNLPLLRELDLSHTFHGPLQWGVPGNGDPFIPAIVASPLLPRLSKLWLQGNGITDEGARALAAAPREVNLTFLDLTANSITDVGKRALRKRFGKGVCTFKGYER